MTVKLTRTEQMILAKMQNGVSDKRMAIELVVSTNTVRTHIRHIVRKHGVHNRYELPGVERRLDPYKQQVIALRRAGKSLREIDTELDVRPGATWDVVRRLRMAGVEVP